MEPAFFRSSVFTRTRSAAHLATSITSGLLPDWADRFEELRALGQKHVVEVLELGIRQGVFAPDLDVAATARVLQDMQVAGTLLGHRTKASHAEVRRQQLAAVRLVMKGLEVR